MIPGRNAVRAFRWFFLLAILWLTLCSACRPHPACEDAAGCARIPPGEPLTVGLALPSDAADCPAREQLRRAAVLALLDYSGLPDHPTRLAIADLAPAIGEDTLADGLSLPTLAGILIPDCGSMVESTRKSVQDAAVPSLFSAMPAGQVNALAAALQAAIPARHWLVIAGERDMEIARALCALRGETACRVAPPDGNAIDPAADLLVVVRPRAAPWRLTYPLPEDTQLVVWDDQSLVPYTPPMANTPAMSLVLQPAGWPDFSARYYRQYGQPPTSPLAFAVYQDTTRLLEVLHALPQPAGGDWLIPRRQLARQLDALLPWAPAFVAQTFLTLNGQLFHGDN